MWWLGGNGCSAIVHKVYPGGGVETAKNSDTENTEQARRTTEEKKNSVNLRVPSVVLRVIVAIEVMAW
jgi:hypothetical protein